MGIVHFLSKMLIIQHVIYQSMLQNTHFVATTFIKINKWKSKHSFNMQTVIYKG